MSYFGSAFSAIAWFSRVGVRNRHCDATHLAWKFAIAHARSGDNSASNPEDFERKSMFGEESWCDVQSVEALLSWCLGEHHLKPSETKNNDKIVGILAQRRSGRVPWRPPRHEPQLGCPWRTTDASEPSKPLPPFQKNGLRQATQKTSKPVKPR